MFLPQKPGGPWRLGGSMQAGSAAGAAQHKLHSTVSDSFVLMSSNIGQAALLFAAGLKIYTAPYVLIGSPATLGYESAQDT